ncbi:AAA family ATPase [Microbacterium sp. MAHUQ-60]|uniref:AAA family ATPase n=1 Tax=unclassified Microbacterium TaxID=2609290 RepID=UPI00361DBCF6
MTSVIVAVSGEGAAMMASDLELEGVDVRRIDPSEVRDLALAAVDALLITPTRGTLTPDLVSACDRAGVRILAVGDADSRILSRFGLGAPLPFETPAWRIVQLLASAPLAAEASPSPRPRVLAVWGPQGAPGRSTVAIQLAVELSRAGRRTALVDADSVAPSIALQLGLGDDAPGLAAACRRAELGSLDVAELSRLSVPVETSGGTLEVLGGLNRPSRWPELGASRVRTTLAACRNWLDDTVVDVSAEFDEDDDPLDPGAPTRHASTTAALREADAVIAVLSAHPLGVSRFVRGYAELRHLVGGTPITVVANRVRPGPLGIDARGQIRRTLDRFAGVDEVSFLPQDQRAADAAALHARAIADVSPRSPLVSAVRRTVSSLQPRQDLTAGSSRGSSRAARRLR